MAILAVSKLYSAGEVVDIRASTHPGIVAANSVFMSERFSASRESYSLKERSDRSNKVERLQATGSYVKMREAYDMRKVQRSS